MERPEEDTGKNRETDDKNLEREGENQIEDERQIVVREQAEQEDGRTEVPPQLPPEWDALSLYTEDQIDEDEVEAAVQSLTAEMNKEDHETVTTSETVIPTETRSVCIENGASGLISPIPEYFPTYKKVLKLKKMAETQNKRIILNVGGNKFETSAPTLLNDPNCILAAMIQPDAQIKPYNIENVYTYFIDRYPRHFHLILNYLRNELQMNIDRLPADPRHLKEFEDECRYYEIKHLELLCTKRLLQIQEENFLKMLTTTYIIIHMKRLLIICELFFCFQTFVRKRH
ncbi:hypothetical protein FSP39_006456 [Pinctada imbricata]|uniref:Potassium channel tetramerisation-type BTB domain-containing protein n=1 Tax=Pinctada imbricata TaxID=66713 RepID=A0AA88XQ72_PINIB|nr:hypothetical protein FSP39_006456 [Pinctada imbricata]